MTLLSATAIRLRPAIDADVPAIVRIERASFSDPWSEEAVRSALVHGSMRALVAEDASGTGRDGAQRLAGYVVALVAGDEGEIADLAVAPEARRRGIGRALIGRMILELAAEGVRSLFLEVRESNVAARALYGSLGFNAVGRRRGYYRNPSEDALLLRRAMGPT